MEFVLLLRPNYLNNENFIKIEEEGKMVVSITRNFEWIMQNVPISSIFKDYPLYIYSEDRRYNQTEA